MRVCILLHIFAVICLLLKHGFAPEKGNVERLVPPVTVCPFFGSRLECERVHSFVLVINRASWSSYPVMLQNHVEPHITKGIIGE